MEQNKLIERDYYIDTVRGLCIISIIFVHTVFHSGQLYVPNTIRNISLLFDVPAFFFLTGCTISVHNKIDPIKQMLKLIIIFFALFFILDILFGPYSIRMFAPLILLPGEINRLSSIESSYWFIPVYVVNLIYATIIIKYLRKEFLILFIIIIPIIYITCWFTHYYIDYRMLGVLLQRGVFYLWLILLGYYLYNKTQKPRFWYGVTFITISIIGLILFKLSGISLNLQQYKFPVVQLPYCVASLFSIGIILVFIRKIKENFFSNIGRKAIYFYASQGIGASVIYLFANNLHCNIYIKLLICFMINLFLSLIIGHVIYLIFKKYGNCLVSENYKLF